MIRALQYQTILIDDLIDFNTMDSINLSTFVIDKFGKYLNWKMLISSNIIPNDILMKYESFFIDAFLSFREEMDHEYEQPDCECVFCITLLLKSAAF
jgi:hypothetical protein